MPNFAFSGYVRVRGHSFSRIVGVITPYSEWPTWLQIVVLGPNGLLLAFTTWIWWPKSNREWRRFALVMAYLIVFYLIMHFVFKF